ncbi:MAG TPA: VOC family protein [Polyangiaceae bacterium]|jgi:PhnB protein|nr:VOC family protein [Polyangiaceae bacterium]
MRESNVGQRLSPYLIVRDAAKAIEFYRQALGARELYRLAEPSGKIGHAELLVGEGRLMLADEYPEVDALSPASVGGTPVSLHLYVDDIDRVVERAVALGAQLVRPVTLEFFGDRTGIIVDPFGHRWQLATQVERVSPAEMQRRWSAMSAGG